MSLQNKQQSEVHEFDLFPTVKGYKRLAKLYFSDIVYVFLNLTN